MRRFGVVALLAGVIILSTELAVGSNLEKWTTGAKTVLERAVTEARKHNSPSLVPLHLAHAFFDEEQESKGAIGSKVLNEPEFPSMRYMKEFCDSFQYDILKPC